MPDLKDAVRRVSACCIAAALAVALWPMLPLSAQAVAAEGTGPDIEQAGPEAPEQVPEQAPEQPDEGEDENESAESTGPAEEDVAADEEALKKIGSAFSEALYVYRAPTRLEDGCFEPDERPAFRLAYLFRVDESVSSPQLSITLDDPADVFTLSVTPMDVAVSPLLVKVDAFYEDRPDPVASLEFSVVEVEKSTIAGLPVASLPFRVDAAEQTRCAADAVRDALWTPDSGFSADDLQAAGAEPFTGFTLPDWPLACTAQHERGFETPFAMDLAPYLEERYLVLDEAKRISVRAIEEVCAPAECLLNGADGTSWFTEEVSAAYAGHALALTLDPAAFQDELPLNSAEGIHDRVSFYAENRMDKVITKVTGVTYRVDGTAPVPVSFSVEGSRHEERDAWFFRDAANVTVLVKDPDTNVGGALEEGASAFTPAVSGLSVEDAWIEYVLVNGERRTETGISVSGPNSETGVVRFVLDGDQAVQVDSFRVHARDRAGNVLDAGLGEVKEMPADVLRLVLDSAAPELTVAFDNDDVRNGCCFNSARTGLFTVHEANFTFFQEYDPDQIIVSLDEDARTFFLRAKDFQRTGDQTWQASHAFAVDAECAVEAQVTDLAGKASDRFATRFIIDQTAPAITVNFADGDQLTHGAYSSQARIAEVTVEERWFSADLIELHAASETDNASQCAPAQVSAWTDEEDLHRCTVAFPGPGVYSLSVSGTDEALNALPEYACPPFTVDVEAPRVAVLVAGEEDASSGAYSGACSVSVSITDANVDPASSIIVEAIGLGAHGQAYQMQRTLTDTQMTCVFPDPVHAPENDDVYQLTVNAADLAGNTVSKTVVWSVNRFGSTYLLSEETRALVSRRYVRSVDLHDVRIQEVNPSGWTASSAHLSLSMGTRNLTLAEDVDYTVKPCMDEGWPAREYTVNKSCFAADGLYQLTMRATDAAGNASMNTMEGAGPGHADAAEVVFAVDDTAPLVTFADSDGHRLSTSEHAAAFMVEDNGEVAQAVVRVNGQETAVYSRSELAASGWVMLDEGGADQALTIEAIDAAGNTTIQDSSPASADQGPFMGWLGGPLGIAVCAAAILSAGGMWVLRRRSNQW